MLPFGSVDDLHSYAEVISGTRECGHQPFAFPSGLGFSSGSGSPSVCEMSKTAVGLNPTSPLDHSSDGVSS